MTFSIRAAGVEDLPQIKAIDDYIFEEDAYPTFVLRQLIDITPELIKVAAVEGEVVGYAIGHHNMETGEAWILSAGVLPGCRCGGIGFRLLQSLVEDMAGNGARTIVLTVQPHNKAGINLYQKLGFQAFRTSENYYLDQLPRLIMKKDLK
ncbi:N-acetyltransferase [Pontibacter brevis]